MLEFDSYLQIEINNMDHELKNTNNLILLQTFPQTHG